MDSAFQEETEITVTDEELAMDEGSGDNPFLNMTPEQVQHHAANVSKRERTVAKKELVIDQIQKREVQREKQEEEAIGPGWFPVCCPDIDGAIGEDMPDQRKIAHFGYRLLLMNFLLFFTNFACNCSYTNAGDLNKDKTEAVGVGIAYIVFGIPGAFYVWWRVLFGACILDRGYAYFVSQCTISISFCFWVVAACGFPGTAMAGAWQGLAQFAHAEEAGITDSDKWLYFVTGSAFGVQTILTTGLALATFWLLKRVRDLYTGVAGSKLDIANTALDAHKAGIPITEIAKAGRATL